MRGASRERHLAAQLAMAAEVASGARRVVAIEWDGGARGDGARRDGYIAWAMPEVAAAEMAAAARRRVQRMREEPPKRGRPPKRQL
jgi:hypothetical protein